MNSQTPKPQLHTKSFTRRVLSAATGLVLVAGIAVGCSSSSSPTSSPDKSGGGDASGCATVSNGAVTVVTKQFDFDPACMTLTGNRLKVTYDNEEKGVKHNFHLKDAKADSGDPATELKAGIDTQTITYVGLKPGTYTYVCDIHANMKGELTVK